MAFSPQRIKTADSCRNIFERLKHAKSLGRFFCLFMFNQLRVIFLEKNESNNYSSPYISTITTLLYNSFISNDFAS